MTAPFRKVLVANRGEIAVRIIGTLERMGIASVAVYSDADAGTPAVLRAGEAVRLGPGAAGQSYLLGDRIVEAALATGAEAVHPGYGFLSESAEFAAAVEAAGLAFIGPTPEQVRNFGRKDVARRLAREAGLPLLAGTEPLAGEEEAVRAAAELGYPVILKSTAGGGGIGMEVVEDAGGMAVAFARVTRQSQASFGAATVYLERFVPRARHIEVQIFGDGAGGVVVLGERDCSAQRRHQKVIEETPAPSLSDGLRAQAHEAAATLARSVAYRSAGTVEFVLDADRDELSFLEMNTRLQVEHGVTEAVTAIDLVEWMVRLAAGEWSFLSEAAPPAPTGHAMEVRVYAEDPANGFRPSGGLVTEVTWPGAAAGGGAIGDGAAGVEGGVRCDTWIEAGLEVSAHYDPMLAKLITHGATREEARERLVAAVAASRIAGIETNLEYLGQLLATPEFAEGRLLTRTLAEFDYRPSTIEVLAGGPMTTVQDHPGRLRYWAVGVPPSGPMDDLSFRLGNRAIGNAASATGLELTVSGPTLRFHRSATICLTGAEMAATLQRPEGPAGSGIAPGPGAAGTPRAGGEPVPFWEPVDIPAGSVLTIGTLAGPGSRAYLLVRGGFDVPHYLGSRATFTLGRFGGHGGRALQAGDVLRLAGDVAPGGGEGAGGAAGDGWLGRGRAAPRPVPAEVRPVLTDSWQIAVLDGPHGAPDYFTDDDIEMFYGTDWGVHYNSARTGVRLIGPRPGWARPDGGDAGLHPSNIHDNAYAVGTVDFTGDMPVILGPDGPSLGGFVCPATVVAAERWKLGQLRAGDRVRFVPVTAVGATCAEAAQRASIALLRTTPPPAQRRPGRPVTVLASTPERPGAAGPAVTYRRSGDHHLLVEFGPDVLDLALRVRAQRLMQALEAEALPGVVDITPGVRSLQVHVDGERLTLARLQARLVALEAELEPDDDADIPSRIVHLPLSWDDPSTQEAIRRYMQSVRPDAPWCPSNLEFIRRVNGLPDVDAVQRIVFDARYVVLGLGDVYLGAPVATPLDPRHRLVTTKYNPARTWTPENAVGIGGAYLCVYGMEGPGGYQFVGRTVPVWNRYRTTAHFEPGAPWLLRFFDQIRFFPVEADELLDWREGVISGRRELTIEPSVFRLAEYRRFLADHAGEIDAFRATQQAAFAAERQRWVEQGEFTRAEPEPAAPETAGDTAAEVPSGAVVVAAPLSASVWSVGVKDGDRVAAGDTIAVLEAMKMETAVTAPAAGTVHRVLCRAGQMVAPGQALAVVMPDA
ncbi:MAG: urea carboxylase [Actinomycetota bacterium]|nr:urea carboxylase [Actinomycetota bacterium]